MGGETVLHLCVKYNQLETLKLLVELVRDDGEFLNSKDHDGGNTILNLAVMLKQIEIVKFLLLVSKVKEGANALNWMGFTALEVLEHSPKDFKRFTLQNILMGAGVERANNQNNLPPPSTTMIGHHESGTPTRLSKTRSSQLLEYLRYKSNWIEETRGAFMVVATVITTITYQPALSPPGGVWQTDLKNSNETKACLSRTCEAGTLVLAYAYENLFLNFLVCNTIAFTASLSVIFFLIIGFPLKNKFFMGILIIAMCTTLTFLGITYVLALALLIPEHLYLKLGTKILIPVGVWACLILLVILIHTNRSFYWLVCKICKFILTCAKVLTC